MHLYFNNLHLHCFNILFFLTFSKSIYSYGGYEAEKGISDKFLALSLDRSVQFELKTV